MRGRPPQRVTTVTQMRGSSNPEGEVTEVTCDPRRWKEVFPDEVHRRPRGTLGKAQRAGKLAFERVMIVVAGDHDSISH